jgi:hypothetical protein
MFPPSPPKNWRKIRGAETSWVEIEKSIGSNHTLSPVEEYRANTAAFEVATNPDGIHSGSHRERNFSAFLDTLHAENHSKKE